MRNKGKTKNLIIPYHIDLKHLDSDNKMKILWIWLKRKIRNHNISKWSNLNNKNPIFWEAFLVKLNALWILFCKNTLSKLGHISLILRMKSKKSQLLLSLLEKWYQTHLRKAILLILFRLRMRKKLQKIQKSALMNNLSKFKKKNVMISLSLRKRIKFRSLNCGKEIQKLA